MKHSTHTLKMNLNKNITIIYIYYFKMPKPKCFTIRTGKVICDKSSGAKRNYDDKKVNKDCSKRKGKWTKGCYGKDKPRRAIMQRAKAPARRPPTRKPRKTTTKKKVDKPKRIPTPKITLDTWYREDIGAKTFVKYTKDQSAIIAKGPPYRIFPVGKVSKTQDNRDRKGRYYTFNEKRVDIPGSASPFTFYRNKLVPVTEKERRGLEKAEEKAKEKPKPKPKRTYTKKVTYKGPKPKGMFDFDSDSD